MIPSFFLVFYRTKKNATPAHRNVGSLSRNNSVNAEGRHSIFFEKVCQVSIALRLVQSLAMTTFNEFFFTIDVHFLSR